MAEPVTPPEHIPYKITSQEQTQQLTPDSRFINVWRVSFEGPNGYHSFIEVPEAEYEPARVDELIEAQLEKIIGVHELGPEPHPDNAAEGE
jgi:hypothetical protein